MVRVPAVRSRALVYRLEWVILVSQGDMPMDATANLVHEENRRIRLLGFSADLLVYTLMTARVSLAEAESMIQGVRTLALKLFPDKGEVFDLIYAPRFRRALREAGIIQHHALTVAPGPFTKSEEGDGPREPTIA
jgi:hypothetical protein